jgi:hypothetical protein
MDFLYPKRQRFLTIYLDACSYFLRIHRCAVNLEAL